MHRVPIGTPAPDFRLPSVEDGEVALSSFADAPALLVIFMCNHCPYVRHVENILAKLVAEYTDQGLAVVGISSNDVENYPDDAPELLREQKVRAGFTFPYLYDESQEIAHAYQAACTPDFFLYGPDRTLTYRGEFDGSRPSNDVPVTGESLRIAIDATLAGKPVPEPHNPSVGCGIKWKPGNEPN
jgi:peroxiredoxin